jgi:hypothetical protein
MQREEQSNALSRRHWTITLYMAHHFSEEDFETNIVLARELRRLQEQIELQHVARKRIWASSFNLNTLSDLECLQRYRFKRKDVGFLATLIDWKKGIDSDGKMRTLRKRYLIDPVEATAIMLRRLSTANRLIDLQPGVWEAPLRFVGDFLSCARAFLLRFRISFRDVAAESRFFAGKNIRKMRGEQRLTPRQCRRLYRRYWSRDCKTQWYQSASFV